MLGRVGIVVWGGPVKLILPSCVGEEAARAGLDGVGAGRAFRAVRSFGSGARDFLIQLLLLATRGGKTN